MSLIRFKENFKYIVFDAETESLNLRESRPWQMAFEVHEGKRLVKSHDLVIDLPNFNISKGAAMITKFDKWDYDKKKKPMEEQWAIFNKYLSDPEYYLVGHNILGFDIFQVQSWRREMGMPVDWSFLDRCIDTHAIARAIALNMPPSQEDRGENFLAWQMKFINLRKRGLRTSLSYLGKKYEIPFDEEKLHDALADIELNNSVFQKQIYEIEV